MFEQQSKTDILILGGGIAGCIAAIALSEVYKVTIVDILVEPKEKVGECLAPAARRILSKLGLMEEFSKLENQHLRHLGTKSLWGSPYTQYADPLKNPDGFGWHLNRKAFETFLRTSASKRGVRCIWPAQPKHYSYHNNLWHTDILTHSGSISEAKETIHSTFIIDATGRPAHFVKSQHVKRLHLDKLMACWAIIPDVEENRMSTISASENGWWYSSPIPEEKRLIAFHSDSDLIHRDIFKSKEQFLALAKENKDIQTIIDRCPDQIIYKGKVAANSTRLSQVAGQQWAALGDAALGFDPLSSQGMFNAMASGMQLSELIIQSGIIEHPTATTSNQLEFQYTQQIDHIWFHYLKHKSLFYKSETRWPSSEFWKRRHTSDAPTPSLI